MHSILPISHNRCSVFTPGSIFWTRLLHLLVSLLVAGAFGGQAFAQELARRASFTQEGDVVVVSYDLAGEEGETYEVDLLLSTDGGETYDYRPKAVSGDVGEGVTPGPGKEIRWRVLEDFPEGIQSPNVQFKVAIAEEGGNGWLYTIGGILLAGGGGTAAAVLTGLVGGETGGGGGGGDGNGGNGGGGGSGGTIPPLDPNLPD